MSRSIMSLPDFADAEALIAQRDAQWRPGLGGACHSEVFAATGDAGGAGAALALALDDWRSDCRRAACTADNQAGFQRQDTRAVLWVQTREAARLCGRPYRPGLPEELRGRLIHVLAHKPEDALFALEEGVRCSDIAFVLGEITGNPRALDFTASRRLTLAAERHGVPLYLVRLDAQRDLSSARMRWEVASTNSPAPEWNPQAPGDPVWRAELFRTRAHRPGPWVLQEDKGVLTACRPSESSDQQPTGQAAELIPGRPRRPLFAVT